MLKELKKNKAMRENIQGDWIVKSIYPALLMAGGFVLFSSVHARAETRAESVEVAPFGGYYSFKSDQELNNTPLFGGRSGYNFAKHFGLETAVEVVATRVDGRTRTGFTEGRSGSPMDRVNLIFYHIDAVYHFMPDSTFTPYVVAGAGGSHYSPRISTGGMAAFNVGAGVKYAMTDTVGFRLDVRDYLVTEVMQDTYRNVGAMAEITFAFGGNEKSAPVAQKKMAPLPFEPKGVVIAFDDIHFDFN
ncbi:MAG: outer membrane beta-barrel protein [Desulfurivibrionaceae bacterium]|nr:outer membrane beta-barrel protein [Desulfobulbaceae bacterium]